MNVSVKRLGRIMNGGARQALTRRRVAKAKMVAAHSLGFLLLGLMPQFVLAGITQFRLLEGKGTEICDAYLTNLNSFPQPLHGAVYCDREINEALPGFKAVHWKPLDIEIAKSLAGQIEATIWDLSLASDADPPWKTTTGQKKDEYVAIYKRGRINTIEGVIRKISEGNYTLSTAQVDVDNDGVVDSVVRYEKMECPLSRLSSKELIVLDAHGCALDVAKTRLVGTQGYAFVPGIAPKESERGGPHTSVFIFKDKTYIDYMGYTENPYPGILNVYQVVGDRTEQRCKFKELEIPEN